MKHNRKRIRYIFLVSIIFLIITAIAVSFEFRLSETVIDIARQKVKSQAYIIISERIWEELDKSNISYDNLVNFEKDDVGNIKALKANIIEVNKLKSKLSLDILKALENKEMMTVYVPLGAALGTEILSGVGPRIKVDVMPIGTVAVDIENVITSAGINQTRHQVMMKINAKLSVAGMLKRASVTVSTNVCIAETVIVGNVPESYTSIYASENEQIPGETVDSDIIFDFIY